MKQNEKNKTKRDELNAFLDELSQILLGSLREILSTEPSREQQSPPSPEPPLVIQVVFKPKKGGILRRFINWLW
ncbi:MAG TPA: hypothetical protein VD905_19680 [Flavobacteriales bacterium]|nr:hypothetical protein [Flavobacteriales bacterium]